ncbi:hypothetical protein KEM56_001068 [Ascosphaera pollenicola]|nr:hypothetical protein KEM56_001068 [Ascosphaera pollenicola]
MADSHLPPSGAGPASPTTNRIIPMLDFAQSSQANNASAASSKPNTVPSKKKKKEHATGVGTSHDRTDMSESTLNMQALQERGCYTVDIKGDGNCLFRSLAEQMYGDPERHRIIRLNVISCIESDSSHYTSYIPCIGRGRRGPARQASSAAKSRSRGNMDCEIRPGAQLELLLDHCRVMKNDGEWGDYLEIAGFVHAYGKRIFLYQDDGHVTMFKSDKPPEVTEIDEEDTPDTLHIAYHSYRHYSSVRRFDGPDKGRPNRLQSLDFLLQFSGITKEDIYDKDETDHRNDTTPPTTEKEFSTETKRKSIYDIFPEYDRGSLSGLLQSVGDEAKAISVLLEARATCEMRKSLSPSPKASPCRTNSTKATSPCVSPSHPVAPTAITREPQVQQPRPGSTPECAITISASPTPVLTTTPAPSIAKQSLLRASFNPQSNHNKSQLSRPSSRQSQISVGSKRSANNMDGYEDTDRRSSTANIYKAGYKIDIIDDDDDDEDSTEHEHEDDGEYIDDNNDSDDDDESVRPPARKRRMD